MEMNRPTIVMQMATSTAINVAVSFVALRAVLQALNKPHGWLQRNGLAAILSFLLVVPFAIRQLAPLRDKERATR